MSTLTLQRNVQFLYEEQLAKIEAAALGCEGWQRDKDNPWIVDIHTNGFTSKVLKRSAYVASIDKESAVYEQLIRPAYQGGLYNQTRSVNQYLTHWIYPYRGKFHPQMVRSLINSIGLEEGATILDPFVGSGTTALEASLIGMNCIGVDVSPLCRLLTSVKTRSFKAVEDIRQRVDELLQFESIDVSDNSIDMHSNSLVRDFVCIARMVSLSDINRRKRKPDETFRRNLKMMVRSVEAHANAIVNFDLSVGQVKTVLGDARQLSAFVVPSTIDAVITSPPYSIALDYVKNDAHALEAMEVDLPTLRDTMTGVRGRGAKVKLALYNEDMRQVFKEVYRVLKPNARAVFVVGDATVNKQEYTTTKQMVEWAGQTGLKLERELPKIVFGLYNVMSEERILIFQKN